MCISKIEFKQMFEYEIYFSHRWNVPSIRWTAISFVMYLTMNDAKWCSLSTNTHTQNEHFFVPVTSVTIINSSSCVSSSIVPMKYFTFNHTLILRAEVGGLGEMAFSILSGRCILIMLWDYLHTTTINKKKKKTAPNTIPGFLPFSFIPFLFD